MNAPLQAQTAPEAPQAAEIVPADSRPTSGSAIPWKPVLATAAAVLVAAVLYAGWEAREARPSMAAIPDRGEYLADSDMVQLQQNREALESAGLAAGTIYVRDFAVEDGDAVLFNGATIPLTRRPTPLTATPGTLVLSAVAGSTGCVTLEVGDASGVYQLCLRDGDPIHTRARAR
jgi:hypothetical protein